MQHFKHTKQPPAPIPLPSPLTLRLKNVYLWTKVFNSIQCSIALYLFTLACEAGRFVLHHDALTWQASSNSPGIAIAQPTQKQHQNIVQQSALNLYIRRSFIYYVILLICRQGYVTIILYDIISCYSYIILYYVILYYI